MVLPSGEACCPVRLQAESTLLAIIFSGRRPISSPRDPCALLPAFSSALVVGDASTQLSMCTSAGGRVGRL